MSGSQQLTMTPTSPITRRAGVYQIRNMQNGKIYVGSSVNLNKRWREHRSALNNNRHWNNHLQRAWNRYGFEAFVYEPLITCHSSMCQWYEQQFLDQWNPEYNIGPTAKSPYGVRRSVETKAKISRAKLGRWHVGKLNPTQVREIRVRLAAGEVSREIAEDYGVCSSTIRKIHNGTNWGSLQND